MLVGIGGGFGASVVTPGHVYHHGWEAIHLGEFSGGITDRLRLVAEVWEKAGFKVRAFGDIQPLIWGKLMANVGFSAICTVTGQLVGQVLNDAWAWSIVQGNVREAFAVAQAKKILVDCEDPVAWVRKFGERIPNAQPSMLHDILAGRRTEIDSLNGAVVEEAERLGLSAPVNRVMTILVKAVEQKVRKLGKAYGVI